MPTEPKLPEWITSRTGAKHLASGDLRARVKRTCTIDGWNAHVWRNDEPLAAGWVFCSTDFLDGKIIGEEIARAICETIIREALRADEAEARVAELEIEIFNMRTPISSLHADGRSR